MANDENILTTKISRSTVYSLEIAVVASHINFRLVYCCAAQQVNWLVLFFPN